MVGFLNAHGENPHLFSGEFLDLTFGAPKEWVDGDVDGWEDIRYGGSPDPEETEEEDGSAWVYDDLADSNETIAEPDQYDELYRAHQRMVDEFFADLDYETAFHGRATIAQWVQNHYAFVIAKLEPVYQDRSFKEDILEPVGIQPVGGHRYLYRLNWTQAEWRSYLRSWRGERRGTRIQRDPKWKQYAGGGRRGRASIRFGEAAEVDPFDLNAYLRAIEIEQWHQGWLFEQTYDAFWNVLIGDSEPTDFNFNDWLDDELLEISLKDAHLWDKAA